MTVPRRSAKNNTSIMNSTITSETLQGYAEELFRRSIATTLELTPKLIKSTPVKQKMVEHVLQTVITIGCHSTLDEAAQILVNNNESKRTSFTLEEALKHTQEVYDSFPFPIAGVERMREMQKHNLQSKDIWRLLRSEIHISSEFDDEWMDVADDWILLGKSRTINLGSAEVRHIDDL